MDRRAFIECGALITLSLAEMACTRSYPQSPARTPEVEPDTKIIQDEANKLGARPNPNEVAKWEGMKKITDLQERFAEVSYNMQFSPIPEFPPAIAVYPRHIDTNLHLALATGEVKVGDKMFPHAFMVNPNDPRVGLSFGLYLGGDSTNNNIISPYGLGLAFVRYFSILEAATAMYPSRVIDLATMYGFAYGREAMAYIHGYGLGFREQSMKVDAFGINETHATNFILRGGNIESKEWKEYALSHFAGISSARIV